MATKLNCWEHIKCGSSNCPAYGKSEIYCWAVSGEKKCLMGLDASDTIKRCLNCEVFKVNAKEDPTGGFTGIINQLYFELEKSESQLLLFRKINSLLQSTIELDKTLHIILTCVTAGYGLGFNRSVILLRNENGDFLEDRMMVAPSSREEAFRVWTELANLDVTLENLTDLVGIYDNKFHHKEFKYDPKKITISLSEDNIFSYAVKNKITIVCDYKFRDKIPKKFLEFWNADYFAISPVIARNQVLGVIVADNFVNNRPITNEHLYLLSGFTYHAGFAIENAILYESMEKRAKELEETNERLTEAREILMRAEKLTVMGEMAATVAHEMRTPLISIGGFTRLVKERVNDPESQKNLEIIIEEINRLERIVKDVLDFVRPFELTLGPINVKKVITEASLIANPGNCGKSIVFKCEIAESIPDIRGDSERIKQVIINLLQNAFDSVNENGNVAIKAKVENDFVVIEIIDDGAGIKVEMLEKVSKPFFTTKKEGLGLGLAIAHKIVKEHGGVLSIIPKEKGVIVKISLPAK